MKFTGEGSINHTWAASVTQEQFVKELSGPGYVHLFAGIKNRTAKLKEVHGLCKQKAQPEKQADAEPPATEKE